MYLPRIEQFLAVSAGYRRDALEAVPQALARAAFVGSINLATSLAAGFAAAHVVGDVFRGPAAGALAVAGGLLWGAVVFSFHRVLFCRGRSDPERWKPRLLDTVPRIALALAVAFSISIPLTLRVSDDAIREELASERGYRELTGGRAGTWPAELKELRRGIQGLESMLASLQADGEPNSDDYRKAKADLQRAQAELAQLMQTVQPRLEREVALLNRMLASSWADARVVEAMRVQIAEQQRVLEQAHQNVNEAQQRVAATEAEWRRSRQRSLEQVQSELVRLRQAFERLARQAEAGQDAVQAELAGLSHPSFIRRWRALSRMASDPAHPDHAAVRQLALRLHLLFVLLELAPILFNVLLPANALDRTQEALDFRDAERVVLGVNAQVEQWRISAQAALPPGPDPGSGSSPTAVAPDQKSTPGGQNAGRRQFA